MLEAFEVHCHGAPGLWCSRWPGSHTRMNKISYSGHRFPPEIIQQAIWLYLRPSACATSKIYWRNAEWRCQLLKNYAFVPEQLVTDDLRSTAPRSGSLGSNAGTSEGDGRTIEPRIRISRRGGGSARCSGSRARVQPRNFFPPTPPSTTLSTSNAISSPPTRTARFAVPR